MPLAPSDGARIYWEETGAGTPIIFVHEFGGDHRSWDDQMRHFGRGWRAITMAARGYPRSDAPEGDHLYGQDYFNRDIIAVLDAAGVDKAHVVGLSMGGYAALMVASKFAPRVISCVAAGAGSGSPLGSARGVRKRVPADGKGVRAGGAHRRGGHGDRPHAHPAQEQGPDRVGARRSELGRA